MTEIDINQFHQKQHKEIIKMKNLKIKDLNSVSGGNKLADIAGGYVADKVIGSAVDKTIESLNKEHERQKESFKNDPKSYERDHFSHHGDK